MGASFRKIDYSLRPAKHAERKMLVEVVRRLASFAPLSDYRYVGFGSVWFSDFILFHKAVGFKEMISIEKNTGAAARVEFNRPFRLNVMYESASTALPKLEWGERQVVWLDYDGTLTDEVLNDVRSVARRVRSGSLLCVTVQCNRAKEVDDARSNDGDADAVSRFITQFGEKRIPREISESDLIGWPFGDLARSIVRSEVDDALEKRNEEGDKNWLFKSVCEIEYADDALMTTVVGVVCSSDEADRFELCAFDKLDFLGTEHPVRINMPKITLRELRYLERQLPIADGMVLDAGPIPGGEAASFARMYRYFPNFSVLET